MDDRIELCQKLIEVIPELGDCGIDINVTHDDELHAWRISYEAKGERALTFLDEEDVDRCLVGRECFSLTMAAKDQLVASSRF